MTISLRMAPAANTDTNGTAASIKPSLICSRQAVSAPEKYFFFHYRRRPRPDGSLAPRAQSDWLLPLPPAIFAAKQRIMTGIYGFAPDGIDTRYCPNPEAYKIFENKL